MKRLFILVILAIFSCSGCGYTQKVTLPNNIQTIAVPTFENAIPPQELFTYRPGIEIELTNAIIDRVIFDGNLKIVDESKADAVLRGKITAYRQEGVRFDNLESIQEYRLFLIIDFDLIDRRTNEVIISEKNFSGRTEYFTSRTTSTGRRSAGDDAVQDLARNLVDRIVEEW